MCALPHPHGADAWLQSETLPLFQREVRERLSPTALSLLLGRAEVLVEGGNASGRSARGKFLGSAMLTIDLAQVADRLRPPHDEDAATRLAAAIRKDPAAREAVIARALEVARARLSSPTGLCGSELSVRVEGCRVLIDLELDAPNAREGP